MRLAHHTYGFKERRELTSADGVAGWLQQFRSAATLRKYRAVLHEWESYLLDHGTDIESADQSTAAGFLDSQPATNSEGTTGHKAIVLHSLYRYLRDYGLLSYDPFALLLRRYRGQPGAEIRPAQALPFDAVKRLLKLPAENQEGRRNRVLLVLLFVMGLRIQEATNIKLSQVRSNGTGAHYVLLTNTKKGKNDEQPIPDAYWKDFETLLQWRAMENGSDSAPLLCQYYADGTPANEHIGYSSARRLMRRLYRTVGIRPGVGVSTHSGRATAATKLFTEHEDPQAVQKFLRHSSVSMSLRYDKRRFDGEDHPGRKMKY